jgi:hypothetical protein
MPQAAMIVDRAAAAKNIGYAVIGIAGRRRDAQRAIEMVLAIDHFALGQARKVSKDARLIFGQNIKMIGRGSENPLPYNRRRRGEPCRALTVLFKDDGIAALRDQRLGHAKDMLDAAIDDRNGRAEENDFHLPSFVPVTG